MIASILVAIVVLTDSGVGDRDGDPFERQRDVDAVALDEGVPFDQAQDTGDTTRVDSLQVSPFLDTGARPMCLVDDSCQRWTRDLPGRGPIWWDASVNGNLLVLTDRLGTLALDLSDGTTRWSVAADPTAETGSLSHAVSDSLVVLIARDGALRGYERTTGRLRWVSPWPAAFRVRNAVDHDGVVVVTADAVAGDNDVVMGLVAGFDRATGERLWSHRATSATSSDVGPVVFDAPLRVRGLDPVTGDPRWEAAVTGPLGRVRGVGAATAYLGWAETLIIDVATGDHSAQVVGPPPIMVPVDHAEVAVLHDDTRIVLVGTDGMRWSASVPAPGCCRAASVVDGAVVLVADDGERFLLALDDGALLRQASGRAAGSFAGTAWVVPDAGNRRPGRPGRPDPDLVALRVFDALGDREVARTPPGATVAGLEDGVLVAGAGWLSRITTG